MKQTETNTISEQELATLHESFLIGTVADAVVALSGGYPKRSGTNRRASWKTIVKGDKVRRQVEP
jgi:hypothetical protein